MDSRPNLAVKSVKFFQEKSLRKLTRPIGAEIEKQNTIAVMDALFIRKREDKRRHELVGLAFLVLCRDGLSRRNANPFTFAQNDRIPGFFRAIPTPITIHGEIATNHGHDLRTHPGKRALAFVQNMGAACWRSIPAVREGVHEKFLQSGLMCGLSNRKKVRIMTMHAAVGNETEQV